MSADYRNHSQTVLATWKLLQTLLQSAAGLPDACYEVLVKGEQLTLADVVAVAR